MNESCNEQNADWAGKKHRKIRKNNKLSLSSSFHISMWIAIHSFMFHYNLMSGRFYGAGPARVAHWSFGKDLVSSEKKLIFSVHTFFSLQHRSGRGDIMRQTIAQAKSHNMSVPCREAQGTSEVGGGGYSWLPQPPHSHTPIPMGWFVLVYANSPFA